jgi:hypothetical protein
MGWLRRCGTTRDTTPGERTVAILPSGYCSTVALERRPLTSSDSRLPLERWTMLAHGARTYRRRPRLAWEQAFKLIVAARYEAVGEIAGACFGFAASGERVGENCRDLFARTENEPLARSCFHEQVERAHYLNRVGRTECAESFSDKVIGFYASARLEHRVQLSQRPVGVELARSKPPRIAT